MKGPSMRLTKTISMFFASLMLMMLASNVRSHATAVTPNPTLVLPNPVLYLTSTEFFSAGGKDFIRYKYDVFNKDAYPADLFAAAPALPPCGRNTKSSRTWVDFFDSRGKRLYGFCALGKSDDLTGIWFALESDVVPPSYIYIEMNDRQTNT